MEYIYLGDRLARLMGSPYAGKPCRAIRRDTKCIRGRNSNMLVAFEDGTQQVIPARMLRKIK
jgi:hypothetical protein